MLHSPLLTSPPDVENEQNKEKQLSQNGSRFTPNLQSYKKQKTTMLRFMETTLNREEEFQGHRPCSAHGSAHQFVEGLLWHVLDGFPHVTQ